MKKILLKNLRFCLLVCFSHLLQAQNTSGFTGTWMARGYGWVAEIDTETVHIYDLTKSSCIASAKYPVTLFSGGLTVTDNVLTMKRGVTLYTFDAIEKLPNLCTNILSKKELKNPLYNFDVLWNTFNEQYAYFKERNINWQQLGDTYREKIDSGTSPAELLVILDAMLKELNDGHVSIEATEKIMKKAAKIGDWDTQPDADIRGAHEAIFKNYVKNPKRHNISRTVWGKINDSIGYIQINSMGLQANIGITDSTTREQAKLIYADYLTSTPDTFQDDIDGMHIAMKNILKDLKDTNKIILDLRFNGGGEDMIGLTALSYFVDSSKTVFYKKNRNREAFTKPHSFEQEKAAQTYDGKLFILQSHYSASATEIVLLSSLAYENITRLGAPSEGIFSDILEKKLPNGWVFGLSNQVYEDIDGINYEAKGIPVHVDFNYPKDTYKLVDKLKEDLKSTGDTAIEYILKN